jgi:hypothetical protein
MLEGQLSDAVRAGRVGREDTHRSEPVARVEEDLRPIRVVRTTAWQPEKDTDRHGHKERRSHLDAVSEEAPTDAMPRAGASGSVEAAVRRAAS